MVLEFASVHKRFADGVRGEVHAVRGVSLAIAAGHAVLLVGESGSGKSSLLALGAGVLLPTEGEVRVQGEPFSRLRERFRAEVRRRTMGVVLQSLALVPRMGVLENVTLFSVPDGGPDRATIDRARASLESLGIGHLAAARVDALSGGERQRVAIARALAEPRALLLLDEPTAHLDETHALRVIERVRERVREGSAALVVTHDPRWTEALAGEASVRSVRFARGSVEPDAAL